MLGFGVFQINDLAQCEQSVVDAIEAGYRLIDTAESYRNEEAVGRAIKRCGVPREELFVTTKVFVEHATYEGTKSAFKTSMDKLQLDYLDLYLIHQPFNDVFGAWRAMTELYKSGNIEAIGVANFASDRLVDFILGNEIAPMVNQIETHPFNQQIEARKIMDEYHVQHESWAPFAEGKQNLFGNEVLKRIGAQYGKSPAQVTLRWDIQRGIVTIPKSTHKERIVENFNIFDFELSEDDMQAIGALDEKKLLFVSHEDPEFIKALYNRKLHD